jgi:hypothetical protein
MEHVQQIAVSKVLKIIVNIDPEDKEVKMVKEKMN